MSTWYEAAVKKNWNSLDQLKNFIEKNNLERIIHFNGSQLETDKAYYGLYAGELSIERKTTIIKKVTKKKVTKKATKRKK